MDIAGLSMAISQNNIMNKVGTAVLSQTMDAAEQQGAGIVAMIDHSMELSVNPSVGGNFDMSV